MREIKFRAWDGEKMYAPFNLSDALCAPSEWFGTENIFLQWTGLTDKNGVEIYEGDLLNFDLVEWDYKNFPPEEITIEKLITGDFCGTLQDISKWREVIGNIYENPELMK